MNMINELIKEKHEQVDREEEAKIMNAIHRQAKESYYMEKGKNYLKQVNKKKNIKKRVKKQIVNDLVCFTLMCLSLIPVITLLIVLHK